MREIGYGDFSLGLYEKHGQKRIPLRGTFEPTFRCNLKCCHCYCPKKCDKSKELTLKEISRIFDEIAKEGCTWLVLTGGEPLLREDFLDIYTYAKKQGFLITLFTNGTLINSEIADYFKKYPPFSIEISLYGITEQTYENVTQVKGSFKQCLKGIDLVLERKLPLTLKTMLLTLNKHELWGIKNYAKKKNIPFRYDAKINPMLDKGREPCKYRITPEEIVELDRIDKDRYNEWYDLCKRLWGPPGRGLFYTCGAGLVQFQIDPYGRLNVCILSRHPQYDLRKGDFKNGWYNEFPKVFLRKPKGEYICGDCEFGILCGYCPGWSELESNGNETPIEYLCRIGHLRARMLGITNKKGGEKQNEENKEAISETTTYESKINC
jgi:MoaA/NifB/PqqE/SkfB family radical SAM enzyme